ncbi:MAG: Stp1/IreP family PP2C-type Ser/Thr phosphatase [Anaerotignum sp.]|nr:Stp1/IreP family PP2C-type Ser/Thr phosphatase [Anaerotignum sp.]MBR5123031.1 Stp1/IreP family PP2C-type Ser/Thr phosphatase [Anaerotignum sp.]MBR6543480.1 Stp1/IreP family PP2C-type Ser/Thr phosphatase [Anaerotignum sp.]
MKAVGMSDIGKCRKNNEDAYYISAGEDPAENLYLVADGMGGCNAGEVASSSAIEAFLAHFWKEMKHATTDDMLDMMAGAMTAANKEVYTKSNSAREFAEMGTTMVAAAIREDKVYVAHVGDSRAYIFRKREMIPLTTDHSYVMELVKMGNITKEEAATHPKRNVITRAIGIKNTVEADTVIRPLQKNDIIVLCTDGLSGMLKDEEMAKILNKRTDLEKKAELLVEEANKKGGFDNISLVLVQI